MAKKKSQEKKLSKSSWSSRVKGDEESLGTNVFDYGQQGKMSQYSKTFKAIISHIGRIYSQPSNVIVSLRSGHKVDIPELATPTYKNDTTGTDDEKKAAKTYNSLADLYYYGNKLFLTCHGLISRVDQSRALVFGQD